MRNSPAGSPLTVILMATAALTLLSLLPWDTISGGHLRRFNLLSDLMPAPDRVHIAEEHIDPELEALVLADTVQPLHADTGQAEVPTPPLPADFAAPRAADGTVLLEDYSPGGEAMRRLRAALAAASTRTVRIAVTGDSYIEGDIFTQDLRSLLQERYGGRGVGYMAAHSNFPGFRQSVRQTSAGWDERDMRHIGSDPVKPLSGVYFAAGPGATVTYKGSERPPHADSWSRSTVMFIAPAPGTVTLTTDGGTATHRIDPSPEVQSISADGDTRRLTVATDIAGLKMLGAWLEDPTGIALDCMSMRGNSGLTHRSIDADLAGEMRRRIDYDLIVMQYGVNALTASRHDYSAYATAMVKAVGQVRDLYPDAAILVMGIGDRGQKRGSEVHSMATAQAMVQAQRDIARRTGAIFWDTRAAMGGDDAAVDWHRRHLVNADYIHLSHKGGAELARLFVNALYATTADD